MAKRRPTETVATRFGRDTLGLLDKARKPFGDSRGDHMRRLVIATLERDTDSELIRRLEELQASVANLEIELQKTQRAMRRILYAILVTIGDVDASDAHEIAGKLFEERD
ncbi:MAG: hypothetical protein F9B45_20755 [Phycisphaera sp. RhM]|nr:hypothetical protein [Phycisphaera sp. RhM]